MGLVKWIIVSLRIPGTWVDQSACVERALEVASVRAGDCQAASSMDLLKAVLEIQDAGIRRLLVTLGCDPQALLQQASGLQQSGRRADKSCLAVIRDAYRVVPATAIHLVTTDGFIVNRKQVLHSCHLIAGFSRHRRSDASLLLRQHGVGLERAPDLAAAWSTFHDAG
ncbi:MAG: hypothetical protein H6838_11135 [Planctomycetes bacterium]|nr:hypothetical protein [Planctomycetota bacterium]